MHGEKKLLFTADFYILNTVMNWIESLSFAETIYWAAAIVATVLFLVQTILAFLGSDADASEPIDVELEDTSLGSQFFTLKSMLGFFMLFGWCGLGCLQMELSGWLTVLLSVVAGLVMMFCTAVIFYFMSKMTDSGTLKVKNAIGGHGEVYLVIPALRSGQGKVHITVQGSMRELDALTDDPAPIATGSIVKVIAIVNDRILLVSRN